MMNLLKNFLKAEKAPLYIGLSIFFAGFPRGIIRPVYEIYKCLFIKMQNSLESGDNSVIILFEKEQVKFSGISRCCTSIYLELY